MVLAIDLDGVLCDPKNRKPGFKMGEPVAGAPEAMRRLKRAGHTLIIHTVRGNDSHVSDWLDHFGIPYDQITDNKPNADRYLDDKGVQFRSWALLTEDPKGWLQNVG